MKINRSWLAVGVFSAIVSSLVGACSGGGGDDGNNGGGPGKFAPQSTRHATAGTSLLVAAGQWLVYLADEATTDTLIRQLLMELKAPKNPKSKRR